MVMSILAAPTMTSDNDADGHHVYVVVVEQQEIDKDPASKVIIIAQQIAQGMGYLHHKGIIHKVGQNIRNQDYKVSKSF